MPKAGGTGTRSSVRAAEKAALEAEQAAAVVDAETTAKEAQAEAAAAAEELAAYRVQVESAAEEAQQKAAAELAELKEQLDKEKERRVGSPVRAGRQANPFGTPLEGPPAPAPQPAGPECSHAARLPAGCREVRAYRPIILRYRGPLHLSRGAC